MKPAIRLLQASVDSDDTSDLRILVEGRYVKYISIEAGLYDAEDMCFEPVLVEILPPLPPGDWNTGHVSRDPTSGQPTFTRATKDELPAITCLWHARSIDHLQLDWGAKLRSNVYEATVPGWTEPVIVKLARFQYEIPWLESETQAYQWIQGKAVGPKFLGHLTEEGRAIGFIVERVPAARHPTIDDLELCTRALERLHALGIKHGDINKHNFLVTAEGATLIDFDGAERVQDQRMLDEELQSLTNALMDTSGRGGMTG